MPVSPKVRLELRKRWKGPLSPYREALDRVIEELGNHVVGKKYVPREQKSTRVSGRIKDPRRICEKVDRHRDHQVDTIDELESLITDIVGVRVSVDYLNQAKDIEKWVTNHTAWTVLRVENTERDNGYRAIHVDLQVNTTNFKKVNCEVQIRTLLQDAWSVWSHPLYEKYRRNLLNIPEKKRGQMKRLSDLLNTADEFAQTFK